MGFSRQEYWSPVPLTPPYPHPNAPTPNAIAMGMATGNTLPLLCMPSLPFWTPWETALVVPKSHEIYSRRKQELG